MRELRELLRYRDVLFNLVKRELKVRYKNSVLGFLWSLLNPLLQILVLVIVFKLFMEQPEPNYSVKLVTTILPWFFFAQVLQEGAACVAEEISLVKKVYFPRLIVPLVTLAAGVIHFLLSLVVLVGMFVVVRVTVAWDYIPLFVVCIVIQVVFMLGLILLTSSLSVFYNDVRYILGSVTMMWFFLSPVLYMVNKVMEKQDLAPIYKTIYMLNPMAPIMVGYRSVLPLCEPAQAVPHYYAFLGIAACVAVALAVVGAVVFRRYQWTFAEHG